MEATRPFPAQGTILGLPSLARFAIHDLLLLSDIGMPEMDGLELIRRVRALGSLRGEKVPAIALTAFARSEDRTLTATVASVAGRTGDWYEP
jgi:CheY-like chemotaxis protein